MGSEGHVAIDLTADGEGGPSTQRAPVGGQLQRAARKCGHRECLLAKELRGAPGIFCAHLSRFRFAGSTARKVHREGHSCGSGGAQLWLRRRYLCADGIEFLLMLSCHCVLLRQAW